MAKGKTSGIYFKVSERERRLIEQRMVEAGVSNMSAFIRKMCLNGYLIKLEIPELKECSRYLGAASNNLNQIARRVNSGGGYYPDDLEDLRVRLDKNQKLFGRILEQLSKIA